MARNLDLEFARRYKARAWETLPGEVLEVRLFGSRARGDSREDSDLDLFVLQRHEDRAQRRLLIDLAWDLAYEMHLPYQVSAHVMSHEHYTRILDLEMKFALDLRDEGVPV